MRLRVHAYRMLSYLIIRWQESGENLAVFCYLILWDAFAVVWPASLAPNPKFVRLDNACSNRFFTFSAPSLIPKGFEN